MSLTHLQDLNPPQLEAVTHFRGPILVLAGAGSGKTRILTRRVINLVLEHRIPPWRILAVTFTNKATDEMKNRLKNLLGDKAKDLWVGTFHSTALRILRRHAPLLSYSQDFVVYDEHDSGSVIKGILKEHGLAEKKYAVGTFMRVIDRAKNSALTPEEFAKRNKGTSIKKSEDYLYATVYESYQQALMRANAMDFGDLLLNVVLLLKQHEEVRSYYQQKLEFVLVDEFQDTNVVQYMFIKLLCEKHRNLLVVGDDDQSIYAFRGATIENILNFERDFTETKVIKLEQNYRSYGNILTAAHAVIKKNQGRKGKKLWTAQEAGPPLVAFTGDDEIEEAEFVGREIEKVKGQGIALSQCAIFYRTNAQSRALEEDLISRKIPYRIFGGLKFYDRKEIKDIIAYMRLLVNSSDDQSFLRTVNTPPRGVGGQTLEVLGRLSREKGTSLYEAALSLGEEHKGIKKYIDLVESFKKDLDNLLLSELIHKIVHESGYGPKLKELAKKDVTAESRLENLMELEAIGRGMENREESNLNNLRLFLDRVSLTSSNEKPEETGQGEKKITEAVSLMTLHLAKGLEFKVVFLTGMEEGLLPHYRSLYDAGALEEERRLCYVGITRAMERLYLSWSEMRGMFHGSGDYGGFRQVSRFFMDIPRELLKKQKSLQEEEEGQDDSLAIGD